MTAPLLEIEDLHVAFGVNPAVRGLDLSLRVGETLALVGESGSGKSATALSILRLIEREGGRIVRGSIRFGVQAPVDLSKLDERAMRRIRGRRIAMVFQEPLTALNPVMTIGAQMRETLHQHRRLSRAEADASAVRLLERVRVPEPERRLRQYPHELSGGQRQRVMIAMALSGDPELLIADEPSTALDVTTQARLLLLLRELQDETGMAILFITHDMGVVAEMAHRVAVLKDGRLVESGPRGLLLARPEQPYTRRLLAAAPRLGLGAPAMATPPRPLLEVENLTTVFAGGRRGFTRRSGVRAVDDVSFVVGEGETLGIVGESGCGKSTLARSLLGLAPVASGRVRLDGANVLGAGRSGLAAARRKVQMIHQDPFASLNPRLPAWFLVTEPAFIHGTVAPGARRALAQALLDRVGLGAEHLDRHVHAFSGGQRQRLCIARALSVEPRLVIADEPVAALDASIARDVTNLMRELQERLGLSFLFISHDMAVVERMSHRVAVMRAGRIVETGETDTVLARPTHAYTQQLIASVPRLERTEARACRSRTAPARPKRNEKVAS